MQNLPKYIFFRDELLVFQGSWNPRLIDKVLRQIKVEHEFLAIELESKLHFSLEKFLPLRQALTQLTEPELFQAIKAYFLLRWDRTHQYCGACGQATQNHTLGFERRCPKCKLSFFPRISPCIIVRITKNQEILMARSPHFAPGVYGLIAGFVEAGETVEQAVHREVYEETGLSIHNLKYFGSQPWPFPDALMLGFTAEYAGGNLKINHQELEDGGWYSPQNLPGRPTNPHSLASQLIDDFMQSESGLAPK